MLGLALEALELVDSHCRRTLMMLSGDSISEVAAVAVLDANTAQRSWANAGSLSVVLWAGAGRDVDTSVTPPPPLLPTCRPVSLSTLASPSPLPLLAPVSRLPRSAPSSE